MAARILCVDDEHDICRLLDTILSMNGYRALIASTAAGGLSKARLRPDLVILDINLPDVDGIEACRRLRRMDPRVPVIFLTAATSARRAEALAAGGDAFLEKPFDVEELLALVAQLLARGGDRRGGRERRVRASSGPRAVERRSRERRGSVLHAAARAHGPPGAPRPTALESRQPRPAPADGERRRLTGPDVRGRARER